MTRKGSYALAILIALALVVNIPYVSMARNTPQPKGGIATVVGVDRPDNCLRIRSGPGSQYDVIGCANLGDQLNITGVWTSNDWAQLVDSGWVYGPQIETDLRPPRNAYSGAPTYVVSEEVVPDYDDWTYLPTYGYDTYWYGGIPIYFYNVAVWRWFHPWWWWRGLQAWWWKDGYHGRRDWNRRSFATFARTRGVNVASAERANVSSLNRMVRTTRSASIATSNVSRFNVNRRSFQSPNVSRFNANRRSFQSPNVSRFNANRRSIQTPNVSRFNVNRRSIQTPNVSRFNAGRRSIQTPNVNRFRTVPNASRSRIYSSPQRFRSGSANAVRSRSFSAPRTFSAPRSFSAPRTFSAPKTFRGGSFGGRIGAGGGVRFGGARMGGGGGRRR